MRVIGCTGGFRAFNIGEHFIAAIVDIAIVGAGPYGLSLAAHLRDGPRSMRIFGAPMRAWSHHMPWGMHLKSEGFASDLYDPEAKLTLASYCAERAIPYADIGLPVAIETFIDYGIEFQRRFVPHVENTAVTSIGQSNGHFELTTANDQIARARRVVIATGIVDFAYLPPLLASLPRTLVSHSSQHADLSQFKGRHVAVLGAGASAVDIAAILAGVGADVQLIARRQAIQFHSPPDEPRSLWKRIKSPRSGLGTGWRSRMCTNIPLVFHAMPQSLRFRAVARHLGPAPGWFVREAVVGRVPMHLGVNLAGAQATATGVRLDLHCPGEKNRQVEVEHLIAATGYKVDTSRLIFMDDSLRSQVRIADKAPILNRYFESSVTGLYFVGTAAANSFGPLLRFAYGANFAAKRVTAQLLRA